MQFCCSSTNFVVEKFLENFFCYTLHKLPLFLSINNGSLPPGSLQLCSRFLQNHTQASYVAIPQAQRLQNFVSRSPLPASKNNNESLLSCSRKYMMPNVRYPKFQIISLDLIIQVLCLPASFFRLTPKLLTNKLSIFEYTHLSSQATSVTNGVVRSSHQVI